ncbi:MAG: hypothetical protein ACOY0T_11370 [Myxococcota bacterium]
MKSKRGFWCSTATWSVTTSILGAMASGAPGCSEAFTCTDLRNCQPPARGGSSGMAGDNSGGGAETDKGGAAGTGPGGAHSGGAHEIEAGAPPVVGGAGGLASTGGSNSASGGTTPVGAGGTFANTNGGSTAGGMLSTSDAGAGGEAGAPTNPCAKPANGPAQCTAQCPCAIGAGQCTNNDGCNTGLVCGANTGAKFGFSGNACVPKHCDDDALNADETSIDCGGECGCTAEFRRLGFLSSTSPSSTAAAVSADGNIVVGASMDYLNGAIRPFRWIAGTGMTRLSGDLGTIGRRSEGVAVNGDGTIVGGNLANGETLPEEPFVWTLSSGTTKVAVGQWAHLHALSADGRVSVGQVQSNAAGAWGPGIPTKVGNLGPGPSSAFDASGNGSVVVGFATDGSGLSRPTVWSASTATFLDGPAASVVAGRANAITPDARVIVGSIDNVSSAGGTPTHRAMVWTQDANGYALRQIDDLVGGADDNEAIDVSADGQVVIGWGTTAAGKEPFIWNRATGTRRLIDELKARGFEWPNAASIGDVAAISADATTIVGTYQNPEGHPEGWRIRFN